MALMQPVNANTHFAMLGDGADPEVFAAPCGITSVSFNPGITKRDTPVYDCDNPEGETQNYPTRTGTAYSLSLAGVLDTNAALIWHDWYYVSKQPRNVRYKRTGGYFQGLAILSSYEEGAERDNDVSVSATIDFIGEPTWVPA